MDLFSIVLAILLATLIGYVFYERSRQLVPPRMKVKYYMNGKEIDEAWEEIQENVYNTRTLDEKNLGLALITVLDCLDNPEAYDEEAMKFVFDFADEQAAYYRFKYNDEILALDDED